MRSLYYALTAGLLLAFACSTEGQATQPIPEQLEALIAMEEAVYPAPVSTGFGNTRNRGKRLGAQNKKKNLIKPLTKAIVLLTETNRDLQDASDSISSASEESLESGESLESEESLEEASEEEESDSEASVSDSDEGADSLLVDGDVSDVSAENLTEKACKKIGQFIRKVAIDRVLMDVDKDSLVLEAERIQGEMTCTQIGINENQKENSEWVWASKGATRPGRAPGAPKGTQGAPKGKPEWAQSVQKGGGRGFGQGFQKGRGQGMRPGP